MSARVEALLLRLLPDVESVRYLARMGMPESAIPTEELREVYTWTMDYYGRTRKAPTVDVLIERFTVDFFADHEVDLTEEPEEAVEWVVESLQANYVRARSAAMAKDLVKAVATATPEDRVAVLGEHSAKIAALAADLTPRIQMVDMREEGREILAAHAEAAERGQQIEGLVLGLPQVDEHYGGVREGEVCIVAAPAKVGKSFFLSYAALKNWEAGRAGALVTLENSVEMTKKRLACQANAIDYRDLERGTLSDKDLNTLTEWVHDVLEVSDVPLPIIQPDNRTPYSLVQQAQALGVTGLYVDQLTFVDSITTNNRAARHEVVRDIMRGFKVMIQGRYPMSLIMAHQVNREGTKNADRTGRLHMTDLAESSEVERAADTVFGLYGSKDMLRAGMIQLQSLAVRRVPPQSYDLHWHPSLGMIHAANPVDLDVDE